MVFVFIKISLNEFQGWFFRLHVVQFSRFRCRRLGSRAAELYIITSRFICQPLFSTFLRSFFSGHIRSFPSDSFDRIPNHPPFVNTFFTSFLLISLLCSFLLSPLQTLPYYGIFRKVHLILFIFDISSTY